MERSARGWKHTRLTESEDGKVFSNFFRRREAFDDRKKQVFVDAISDMLRVQLTVTGGSSIEDTKGNINRKAIGYIYGFIDGALRTVGQNMGDESVGIPLTFHILKNLFPVPRHLYRCSVLAGVELWRCWSTVLSSGSNPVCS